MFAIRARRKTVTEKDFLDAVNKVTPFVPLSHPAPLSTALYGVAHWFVRPAPFCTFDGAPTGPAGMSANAHCFLWVVAGVEDCGPDQCSAFGCPFKEAAGGLTCASWACVGR